MTMKYTEEEYYYKLDNMLLISCQHVRNIFRNRWKTETGKEWPEDEGHLSHLISGVLKKAFKSMKGTREKGTVKKCIPNWDIPVLFKMLLNIGNSDKYKPENDAVHKLTKIRNHLSHPVTHKISINEYHEKLEIFKTSLLSLGMEVNLINQAINEAGIKSATTAFKSMTDMHKKAEEYLKLKQIQQAIDIYSRATIVPNLLPIDRGLAFEKRAECYLKLSSEMENVNLFHATSDATKALELNEYSWNAHYLVAKCHQLKNNLSTALLHYKRSLAISPNQKQVKSAFESCQVRDGIYDRNDHLNPALWPMNLQERLDHLETESGQKMTKEEFLFYKQFIESANNPGQAEVFQGHVHFCGWNVPQDYSKAEIYYAKAALLKNPEGMYNHAMAYHYGLGGVVPNIAKAIEIYREVAEIDRNTAGMITPLGFNIGVAYSQHNLGLLYQEGIGINRSLKEAGKWYTRAMENGAGNSANNLGRFYYFGLGVDRDEKMSEMCWKFGVFLKDHNAPASLVRFYFEQMEPEKALAMVNIGREMGNDVLINLLTDEIIEGFEKSVNAKEKEDLCKMESVLMAFENANNLDMKGLTVQQRYKRVTRCLFPDIGESQDIAERGQLSTFSLNWNWGGKFQGITEESVKEVQRKAKLGSKIAALTLETWTYYYALCRMLFTNTSYYSSDQQLRIIDLTYNFAIRERHAVVVVLPVIYEKILTKCFTEKCSAVGKFDMKIRFCYVAVALQRSMRDGDTSGIELLKEGIRRYPQNVHYYVLISEIFGCQNNFEEGRFYAEMGLKLFPKNVDLLYAYAICFSKNLDTCLEAIEALKKFLSEAPKDHRKVPEAHYQISHLYLIDYDKNCNKRSLELVKLYFESGQKAEQNQLPCYLPYAASDVKCAVEMCLKKTFHIPTSLEIQKGEIKKSVLERKCYLKSPLRKALICQFRKDFADVKSGVRFGFERDTTVSPKLKQTVAKNMSAVKPITLVEMNPTKEQIHKNKILELLILEDPNPNFPSIHLIAEDENGDVTRLYIYNADKSEESLDNFRAGCKIGIVNPYMRIGAQGVINGIRVDEPGCILYLEKLENMCRFCGKENVPRKCSKCKRPYCSKECQSLDWKTFQHKLICNL